MIPDLDVYRSAQPLIERHGDDAPMKADEMLDKGDLDGLAVWKRIIRAIGALLLESGAGSIKH